MSRQCDLIVIGMGVSGEEVAGRAAGAGMDVVGIERKLVGSECPPVRHRPADRQGSPILAPGHQDAE